MDTVRQLAVAGIALAVLACEQGETTGPLAQPLTPSFSIVGPQPCGTYNNNLSVLPSAAVRRWGCGDQITYLQHESGGNFGALQTAVGVWNGIAGTGMPKFVTTSQTRSVSISGSLSSTVKGALADSTPPHTRINLASLPPGATDQEKVGSGSPAAVTVHELGHLMGLSNDWDGGGYRVSGVSDHCAMGPTGPGGTHTATSFCPHLKETFRYIYGLTNVAPNWGKHIVTSVAASIAPSQLIVGTNGAINASALILSGGSPSACDECSPPANSVDWTSDDTDVVSVVQSGNGATLVPHAPGTAKLYPSISSGVYQLASYASPTVVTVVAAPPPPPPPPPTLNVIAVANNDELSNFVQPNQTCLWMAQSNISGTSYTWQQPTKLGGWSDAGTGNILSVATGSQQTTKPYRVIGVNGAQADTFNFDIVVTSSGLPCNGW